MQGGSAADRTSSAQFLPAGCCGDLWEIAEMFCVAEALLCSVWGLLALGKGFSFSSCQSVIFMRIKSMFFPSEPSCSVTRALSLNRAGGASPSPEVLEARWM